MQFVTDPHHRLRTANLSIAINNDRSHQLIVATQRAESRKVRERKVMDKAMNEVIKERLFSKFTQNNVSPELTFEVKSIHRSKFTQKRMAKTFRTIDNTRRGSSHVSRYIAKPDARHTIDLNKTTEMFKSLPEPTLQMQRMSLNLNPLAQTINFQKTGKAGRATRLGESPTPTPLRKRLKTQINAVYHSQPLQFNEKSFVGTFREWATGGPAIYDLTLTRESIIRHNKHLVEERILERFLHFFCFPPVMTLRKYGKIIENAANTNLRFIYFWHFQVLDRNSNGKLTSQDLFKIITSLSCNSYIEGQVLMLAHKIAKMGRRAIGSDEEGAPIEESLTANHNLNLEQLKEMLKRSQKEEVGSTCVKSTCYHQTITAIEHHPADRSKMAEMESAEETTQMLKLQMLERKQRLRNQPGLRLRDFFTIFDNHRPKMFCFILQLLTGIAAEKHY